MEAKHFERWVDIWRVTRLDEEREDRRKLDEYLKRYPSRPTNSECYWPLAAMSFVFALVNLLIFGTHNGNTWWEWAFMLTCMTFVGPVALLAITAPGE